MQLADLLSSTLRLFDMHGSQGELRGQHHEIFNFFCKKKTHLGHRTDKKRFRDFFLHVFAICYIYLKMVPIEVKRNSCWAPASRTFPARQLNGPRQVQEPGEVVRPQVPKSSASVIAKEAMSYR